MWLHFFLENAHFAIGILASFVFLFLGWLYWDAAISKKSLRNLLKIIGFLLLAVAFAIEAIHLESQLVTSSFISPQLYTSSLIITKTLGYVFSIIGLLLDPIEKRPGDKSAVQALALPATIFSFANLTFALPILATTCAILYLKRATIGLEDHLKPISFGFFSLAVYELTFLYSKLASTNSPDLYVLFGPFGPVWIARHVMLFVTTLIIGRWVTSYLLKRFVSQLYVIFIVAILAIFLTTAVAFSALLLRNIEEETKSQIQTNVKVLNFAIESKRAETLSNTQVIAKSPETIEAVKQNDKGALNLAAEKFILNKNQSSTIIVSVTGQVIARGEDRERIGESLSGDALIKRALIGHEVASTTIKEGALAPTIATTAVSPIKDGTNVIGAVMSSFTIDNAFVDSIKNATSLDSTVYADNILSATTYLSQDNKSRLIGIKEQNPKINDVVLQKGQDYSGIVTILNKPQIAAYTPIKNIDENPIGMLYVAKEHVSVLKTAGKSIETTFVITLILMLLSIVPALVTSNFIANQIK